MLKSEYYSMILFHFRYQYKKQMCEHMYLVNSVITILDYNSTKPQSSMTLNSGTKDTKRTVRHRKTCITRLLELIKLLTTLSQNIKTNQLA